MPNPPAPETSPSTPDRRASLAIVGVAVAGCLTGIANNYAQDDLHLILTNTRVHGLGDWDALLTSPFWPPPFSQDLYRPLTSLLLAVEYAIGDGAPSVYRVVSYLLLAAAALAFFAFARRLLPRNVALAASLLFAAHPVHVEATALAVGQSELLVGLIALVMATRYLDGRRAGDLSRREWLVQGALFAAACFVKEQGYVLPALLLAIELLFVSGAMRERLRALWGGYAALAVILALALAARRAVLGGDVAGTFTAEALVGLGVGGRALTMLRVVPEWLRLLVWPAHLQGDYSPQEIVASTRFGALEAVGAAIVIAAVAMAVASWRRAPVVTFGLLWCAVALFPVSNVLVPTGIVLAERTLFLPSVGAVITVAALAVVAWPNADDLSPHYGRALAVLCAALVGLGVLRSARRQFDWANEPTYAIKSLRDAPNSYRVHRGFGDLLFAFDRPGEAFAAYDRALALSPPSLAWRVRNDLATQLRRIGDRAREVDELRKSLASEPTQRDTRGYLVSALLATGRYADAARECDSALVRGLNRDVFTRLKATADSAARVNAPPGSIDIRMLTGVVHPVR
jgi:tetratricopeptide (TPR) repeat protein